MADLRNAEDAAINPQAVAFEQAKLRMLARERAFEDWYAKAFLAGKGIPGTRGDCRDAYEAGAASRQGEVDRLQTEINRRQEEEAEWVGILAHLDYELDETPMDTLRRLVKEQNRG